MKDSVFTQVLIGLVISLASFMIGKLMGEKGKVSKEYCSDKRDGCMNAMTIELEHIKEELGRIRSVLSKIPNLVI